MGALQFSIILKRLFAQLASPAIWGKAGVEFTTNNIQGMSGEDIPMMVLVMDGVREGNLGMVTTFCHHDQTKIEASEALSALCQHSLPEPSVVIVRRYTNSSYPPQGSFNFLYLDVSTLSGGASSAQFPLDRLCLHRLLPHSDTEVVLPWEEGEEGLKVYPFFWETFVAKLRGGALPLWPNATVSLYIAPHSNWEEGCWMEEGSGFHPALKGLQDINQARAQMECELAQETEGLAQRYYDRQIKLARKHERRWAQMAKEADATFQEVFSQVSLTDLIKLLPWCISSTLTLLYMSDALATPAQQD